MREIVKTMIADYKLYRLGYDFMGYEIGKHREDLSFHHLIVPKRECKAKGLGEGYLRWNGAILMQSTSHDYLHKIEQVDREIFERITLHITQQNLMGKLDPEELLKIRCYLCYFEKEYRDARLSHGKKLIKQEYITSRYFK